MSNKLKAAVLAIGAAIAFVAGSAPSDARPITPAERRQQPYMGDLPACFDQAMLQRIARHFVQREKEYWSSGLEIVAYDKIHETAYRANGLDYIPRRYCRASALMNDGKVRQVVYSHRREPGDHRLGRGRRMVHRRARSQLRLGPFVHGRAAVNRLFGGLTAAIGLVGASALSLSPAAAQLPARSGITISTS